MIRLSARSFIRVCLSGCLSVLSSVCLSVCLSVPQCICHFVCLPVCLSVRPFVCLFVCLSTLSFVCLFVLQCVWVILSVCLSVLVFLSCLLDSSWISNTIFLYILFCQLLKKAVEKYGACNWNRLSEMVPGRSGPQCRERLVTWVLQPQNKGGCLQQNFAISNFLSHGDVSLPLVNNFKIVCLLRRLPVGSSHNFLYPTYSWKQRASLWGAMWNRVRQLKDIVWLYLATCSHL